MKKIILITMLMSAVFAQADECEAETIDTQCNALDSQSDREECRRYYYLLCENTLTEDELFIFLIENLVIKRINLKIYNA